MTEFILILILTSGVKQEAGTFKEHGQCVAAGQAYMHSPDVRKFACFNKDELNRYRQWKQT